jgi:hypothetical protein
MVARMIIAASLALTLTIASAFVPLRTDERAMYGHEGPLEQNWLPRELGGWPAPYLADSPNTSVPHKLGPEDDFRPGSFVATFSFWLLVSLALLRLLRATQHWRSHNSRTS